MMSLVKSSTMICLFKKLNMSRTYPRGHLFKKTRHCSFKASKKSKSKKIVEESSCEEEKNPMVKHTLGRSGTPMMRVLTPIAMECSS
jgi:hypothetical protein